MNSLRAKKILIIGLGKEGISAANYLEPHNHITLYDDKPKSQIDPRSFKNLKVKNLNLYFEKFPNQPFDYVIRSPGIRVYHPLIQKLTSQGSVLTSPTKIFFDTCPGKIIGVTGTKGKGTTSTLIYEMLKTQHKNVFLAGNIGTPALDILPKVTKDSPAVLELSSFQLADLGKSPHVAVVLMITSEHLDWHKDTADYIKAKESIVKYQTQKDFAVINADYATSKKFAQKTRGQVYFVSTQRNTNGVYISNKTIFSNIVGREKIAQIDNIFLPGPHNLQNVVAATAVAKIFDVKNSQIQKVLKSFKGLPHCLELVRRINGVKFYNDSFSTIPETTIAAINAFSNPKILILGGSSKNSDFLKLAQKIHEDKTIKALILIGIEGPRIKQMIDKAGGFGGTIIEGAKNMQEIVKSAKSLAWRSDVVLLSPACASFDMFKNYQDRGVKFINEVKKLAIGVIT